MKTVYLLFGGVLGALSFSLGACGGDVTSTSGTGDPGGAGGSGSSSSTATGNPTGAGAMQACLDFCHKLETMNCGSQFGDCDDFCGPIYEDAGGECSDEADALFECFLDEVTTTCPDDPPAACNAQQGAYGSCQNTYGCGSSECSIGADPMGGTSDCSCNQMCAMKAYETSCTSMGDMAMCDCKIDGMMVGTCDPGPELQCDLKKGCCNQFFKL